MVENKTICADVFCLLLFGLALRQMFILLIAPVKPQYPHRQFRLTVFKLVRGGLFPLKQLPKELSGR